MNAGETRFSWLDVLSVAGLVAALYVVYALVRRADWSDLSVPNLSILAGAVVIGVTALLLAGIALAAIVAGTGREPRPRIDQSIFAANRAVLTKYLPGKIWYVVGISESLVRTGISRPRAWVVVLLYQAILIGTALLFGLVAAIDFGVWQLATRALPHDIDRWHMPLLIGVAILLAAGGILLLRRVDLESIREFRASPFVVGAVVALLHWLLQGISVWIILSGVYGQWLEPATILVVPAVYALGFLVLIAPGGIGVRELLFVQYFLYLGLPVHTAASLAIIARLAALAIEICVWIILHTTSHAGLWPGKPVGRRAE